MKQLFFLILIFVSWFGVKAMEFEYEDLWVEVESGTDAYVYKINSNRLEGDIVIPSHITYEGVEYTVKYIKKWGFEDCDKITSIVIPNTVVNIFDNAFSNCTALKKVELSTSLVQIGREAFLNCNSLENIILPNSLTSLGSSSFRGCSGLKTVEIQGTIGTKGAYMFSQSGIFSGCTGLEKVIINDLAGYCSIVFLDDHSSPLFYAHHLYLNDEEITDLIVPEEVKTIGDMAFKGCTSITNIVFHDNIEDIQRESFSGCTGITDLVLPNSIQYIRLDSFSKCSNLKTIKFPENLIEIEDYAFQDCPQLVYLEFPESLTKIKNLAFDNCISLQSVILGPNVSFVGPNCFRNCQSMIKSAYPDAIDNPFQNGIAVSYPSSATIENGVIYSQDKTGVYFGPILLEGEINLAETVKTIGPDAFSFCPGLTAVGIPLSVEEIGDCAFAGCEGLTSMVIPYSVTTLGENCFRDCSALIKNAYPNWFENPFESGVSIAYPRGAYFEDGFIYTGNKSSIYYAPVSVADSYSIKESIMNIEDYSFYACEGLTEIIIPGNVKKIGDCAFLGCPDIVAVTCLATVPPESIDSMFDDGIYRHADLLVPQNSYDAYVMTDPWSYFYNIGVLEGVGDSDSSGIEGIASETNSVYKVYSIDGKKLFETPNNASIKNLPKGLYVINGKKVAISQ